MQMVENTSEKNTWQIKWFECFNIMTDSPKIIILFTIVHRAAVPAINLVCVRVFATTVIIVTVRASERIMIISKGIGIPSKSYVI